MQTNCGSLAILYITDILAQPLPTKYIQANGMIVLVSLIVLASELLGSTIFGMVHPYIVIQ